MGLLGKRGDFFQVEGAAACTELQYLHKNELKSDKKFYKQKWFSLS